MTDPFTPLLRLLVAAALAGLAVDAALLTAHLVQWAKVSAGEIVEIPYLLDIGADFGLGERWNAIKWATALGVVLAALGARRALPLGVLAAVIAALLADDYLRIHEAMGAAFAATGALPGLAVELRYAVGELLFSAAFGVAAVGGLLIAALRSAAPLRRDLLGVVGLVLLLGGFGVIVDLIHSLADMAASSPIDPALLGFVEDGGEMLVTTALAFAAARIGLRALHGATGTVGAPSASTRHGSTTAS